MRVIVQRVDSATAADLESGASVAQIAEGLVLYVGFARGDVAEVCARMARKVAHLRIFEEGDSLFGRSLHDVGGTALVLSQFTVMADTSRGRRPNFSGAAAPGHAEALFGAFVTALSAEGVRTLHGPFGARLLVDVRNRGPFTLPLEL